ncbi:alpha/beta hydrolase [Paucibacter sp. PLA-PC-4]|uniref:alpha/beta hydrolase n=1 Tax=Paucibacter sp. PLA-PC-4 TaxID=2993655 RepID=UPI00224A5CE4|nr:alpha/beta hydrolase [Paucibacter sp. PLA-PC-4]MCX2864707.1 alpha/beta hydrolase [Paucibacter sp. PLA-PC-4]
MTTLIASQNSAVHSDQERIPQRRGFLRSAGASLVALGGLAAGTSLAQGHQGADTAGPGFAGRVLPDADNFYQSPGVSTRKVRFRNQYGMDIAGHLFVPKKMNRTSSNAAIVVGHPMGAVKEQSANLYATKMAEQGFVALSIDLPFWGESEGRPRNAVSPDLYAEAFSAAVDYLGTQPVVDRERIGVIGVCGSASFAISAAKIDSRMKAIATVSMYDMGAANRQALNQSQTLSQRKAIIDRAARQRDVEFSGGEAEYTSGTVHEITAASHPIEREFYDFYRTPRGEYTPPGQSPLLTTHPTLSSNVKFMNFYPFNDIETISPRPMLFITGTEAHSREFSEGAYQRAAEPKELHWVPGAGHVDLYDRVNLIPWSKLTAFFALHLGRDAQRFQRGNQAG